MTHHFDDNIPISNYLKWSLNLNQAQVILSKQVLERKAVWLKTEEVILAIGKKCSNINNVILINFKSNAYVCWTSESCKSLILQDKCNLNIFVP